LRSPVGSCTASRCVAEPVAIGLMSQEVAVKLRADEDLVGRGGESERLTSR